jgi:type III secretory pathway component EscV
MKNPSALVFATTTSVVVTTVGSGTQQTMDTASPLGGGHVVATSLAVGLSLSTILAIAFGMGFLTLVGLIAGAIAFCIIRRKRRRNAQTGARQNGPSQPGGSQVDSPDASQLANAQPVAQVPPEYYGDSPDGMTDGSELGSRDGSPSAARAQPVLPLIEGRDFTSFMYYK